MKNNGLTPKQQLRTRNKVFKLLISIGFKFENEKNYYWKEVGCNRDVKICVAFDVPDQCLGGRTSWVWQTAKLKENPLFGYSGSTHVGAEWGTLKKVIDITLEHFFTAGISDGVGYEKERYTKLKNTVCEALNLIV